MTVFVGGGCGGHREGALGAAWRAQRVVLAAVDFDSNRRVVVLVRAGITLLSTASATSIAMIRVQVRVQRNHPIVPEQPSIHRRRRSSIWPMVGQQITIIYFAPTNDKIDTGAAAAASSVARPGTAVQEVLYLAHGHAPQSLAEDVDDFVVRLDGALGIHQPSRQHVRHLVPVANLSFPIAHMTDDDPESWRIHSHILTTLIQPDGNQLKLRRTFPSCSLRGNARDEGIFRFKD